MPNAPPETQVTGAPPVLELTTASVTFYWTGSDPDGFVDYFEWRISDNGPNGSVDVADTLGLPWRRTAANDSTFAVSAPLDSFPPDVSDPRRGAHDWRSWQTHTFFIRSVDDQGSRDPSPAAVSFTATTLAPTVRITVPPIVAGNTCAASARVLTFAWEGDDPDDISRVPTAIRWVFYPVPACMLRIHYEANNPIAALPDSQWSPWIAYDAAADSGRTVTLPRQDVGSRFLFAVQARDKAGAVTPLFDWGVNVRHFEVRATAEPLLTVTESLLGSTTFSGTHTVRTAEVVGGQALAFTWSANTSLYGGTAVGFRHGWDVQDVADPNDPGWAGPWGLGDLYRRSAVRTFPSGTHNFVVQVLDNSDTITRAVFQLDVIGVKQRAQQRELLLVQDWPRSTAAADVARDRDWDERWENLLAGLVVGFTRGDVLDVVDTPDKYSFRTLNDYKAVVYFVKGGDRNTKFATFFRPSGTTPVFNWVQIYEQRVGNILMVGPQAIQNTVEYSPPQWTMPLVFSAPEGAPLGFGMAGSGGSTYPVGTTRYPYVSLCVEACDFIRPLPGSLYGEPLGFEGQQRSRECDGIARALVDPGFVAAYPSATGRVVDLQPGPERASAFASAWGPYRFDREEFYNVNRTSRGVLLVPRDCQRTMFKMLARRDDGMVARPDSTCWPRYRLRSPLDAAPIGLVVDVYGDTKPLPGSRDFVWGFHPLAFRPQDVRAALGWIFSDQWQLAAP